MILPKYSSLFLYLVAFTSIHSTFGQSEMPGALWKDKTVPYSIDSALATHRATIEAAMNEISRTTCIRFVPRTNEYRYLSIQSSDKCETVVGSVPLGTPFRLSNQCVCRGIIMHGLYHAVGVPKPGDVGPGHVDTFPCVRLTYPINNPQLCTKNILTPSEINAISNLYKC